MAMEELHAAALAYYDNGTQQLRDLAGSFFRSMDTNGDGQISCLEFNDFLQQSGYNWIINDPNFFKRLDRNGDGGLDFGEVLTFYYIIKTRYIKCQGYRCGVHLCGLYFTCVACFDGSHEHCSTFDLCPACYRNRSYYHHQHHTYFLDNHVLLRSKRGLSPYAPPNLNMVHNCITFFITFMRLDLHFVLHLYVDL
ncbi:putative EF-hand domain pair protein [Rosa chinensis]|uniref:Putative EF-hand domain pair protein n=1 Tax=Rosa chinensis TaxID=74649 RepID=A0A2P6QRL9_ROSCH|nr:putative EF-hand domain pair protein [Rosa chinensis]